MPTITYVLGLDHNKEEMVPNVICPPPKTNKKKKNKTNKTKKNKNKQKTNKNKQKTHTLQFIGLAYQGKKDIVVFRFIIEYNK
jgi:hypothetical protein